LGNRHEMHYKEGKFVCFGALKQYWRVK